MSNKKKEKEMKRLPIITFTGCSMALAFHQQQRMKKYLLIMITLFIFMGLHVKNGYSECLHIEKKMQTELHYLQDDEPAFRKMNGWGFLGKTAKTAEKLRKGYNFTNKKNNTKCNLHLSVFSAELKCRF